MFSRSSGRIDSFLDQASFTAVTTAACRTSSLIVLAGQSMPLLFFRTRLTQRQTVDLHPRLFPSLTQQYAEHQPGQTMSEQECRVISLLAIRCSPLQMSVLMVCTKSNISNLRRRLYQKLTGLDGSGSDLDKYIAEMCKK